MEYLTHERFLEMGGSDQLPVSIFNHMQASCGGMIDFYTFDRIDHKSSTYKEKVEMCIVEMITEQSNVKWKAKDTETKGIKSESVGDYSVTYQGIEDIEKIKVAMEETLIEIIKKHFLHTGLMYRGRL